MVDVGTFLDDIGLFYCFDSCWVATLLLYMAYGYTINSPTVAGCKITGRSSEYIEIGDNKYERKEVSHILQIVDWGEDKKIGYCEYGDTSCYEKYMKSNLCKSQKAHVVCERDDYVIECREGDVECYKKHSCE